MDAKTIIERLRRDGLTFGVAESCTGGELAKAFVDVPGASEVFRGGVVAYHDDVKVSALGIDAGLIERFGAVSAAVAEAMAHGARDRLGCDVAVALTGIAGPTGERPGKPVGTVWLAAIGPKKVIVAHRIHIDGDRDRVQDGAVQEALDLVWGNIQEAEREGQVDAVTRTD